jgi:hypothetical protein
MLFQNLFGMAIRHDLRSNHPRLRAVWRHTDDPRVPQVERFVVQIVRKFRSISAKYICNVHVGFGKYLCQVVEQEGLQWTLVSQCSGLVLQCEGEMSNVVALDEHKNVAFYGKIIKIN